MRILPALPLPLLLLATMLPSPGRAAESFDGCKGFIDTLPAVLATQGTWCLRKDLSTSQTPGVAITIAANNVTLDCNGYKLGGLGAGLATYATGIQSSGRLNTTVRGCSVRGFATGLYMDGGGGHVIEDNRFDANTVAALVVWGDDSTIRRNLVLETGGSTSEPYQPSGVWTNGRVDVLDNTISGVTTATVAAQSVGLLVENPDYATIAGNRIRGVVGGVESVVRGIWLTGGGRPVIRDNVVGGPQLDATVGIDCEGAQATTTGNVVTGFATPISGCASSGDVLNEF